MQVNFGGCFFCQGVLTFFILLLVFLQKLQDIAAQVLILNQFADIFIHISLINGD